MSLQQWLWIRFQAAYFAMHVPVEKHYCFSMLQNGLSNVLMRPRKHFGAPISRRRLFIYLLRRDVMTADCLAEDFTTVLRRKLTDVLLAFSKEEVPQWFLDTSMICFLLLCSTMCWQCWTLNFWVIHRKVAICRALTPRSELLLPPDHPAVVRDRSARVELRKRNAHKLLDFFRAQSSMHWVLLGKYLKSKQVLKWYFVGWAEANQHEHEMDKAAQAVGKGAQGEGALILSTVDTWFRKEIVMFQGHCQPNTFSIVLI